MVARIRTRLRVGRAIFFSLVTFGVFVMLALLYYVALLDKDIKEKFEGRRWDIPAQAYARPLELYPGNALTHDTLLEELELLGYRQTTEPAIPGSYHIEETAVSIQTREFTFWDGVEPSRYLRVVFDPAQGVVAKLDDRQGQALEFARLDPLSIGSFYPNRQAEDRVLVKLKDLPSIIPQTLIAVEDKKFYSHIGVDPGAIVRSTLKNMRAGRTVQGGSTITQQLAKNFFYNSEKSLVRKFREAMTALLLELHYSKDDILETYLNEIYLAQNGARQIHGIAMASRHYFGRAPNNLNIAQVATLIGLLKGPSKYNPLRHPVSALTRRNLVLDILQQDGILSAEQAQLEQHRPLGLKPQSEVRTTTHRYPDYMGLVKQQILRDYAINDLKNEGIRVFTTLDPIIQRKVEEAIMHKMPELDEDAGFHYGVLQPAVITSNVSTGEVAAVVGSRNFRQLGFNRAVQARRNIGSLIKPIVYMTVIEQDASLTLASKVSNRKARIRFNNISWEPQNYSEYEPSFPMLITALAQSYNIASARLGANAGIPTLLRMLRKMGFHGKVRRYPSVLLGAIGMSVAEVSQLYLTLANKGKRLPLRTIRTVTDRFGRPLTKYAVNAYKVVTEKTAYLTYYAMRKVVETGTGKEIGEHFGETLGIAGKTGTTNNTRDSWFAGFAGNYLTVTWVGRDDNRPTHLNGSQGALPLWINVMEHVGIEPYRFAPPEGVAFHWIHSKTGKRLRTPCTYGVRLPFITDTEPAATSKCHVRVAKTAKKSVKARKKTLKRGKKSSSIRKLQQSKSKKRVVRKKTSKKKVEAKPKRKPKVAKKTTRKKATNKTRKKKTANKVRKKKTVKKTRKKKAKKKKTVKRKAKKRTAKKPRRKQSKRPAPPKKKKNVFNNPYDLLGI
jgi:penicillin-binding protein 1B